MPDTSAPDTRATGTGEPHEAEARQTFSRLAAHSLGGVTHAIATSLAMLGDEEPGETLSPRQRELVEIGSGGAARLIQLSDDLLLLTKVAEQTMHASLEPIPLTRLLREAIEQAQTPFISDPPREIRPRVSPALPQALCDPTLARRALAAIIENALRFSPSDTPVTIEARKRRDRATIRVRDGGAGIASADVERIFEPLYVGERPLAQVGVGLGLGLGLAVARACAEAQGGRLSLESADESGATFTLELPFAPISAEPSD